MARRRGRGARPTGRPRRVAGSRRRRRCRVAARVGRALGRRVVAQCETARGRRVVSDDAGSSPFLHHRTSCHARSPPSQCSPSPPLVPAAAQTTYAPPGDTLRYHETQKNAVVITHAAGRGPGIGGPGGTPGGRASARRLGARLVRVAEPRRIVAAGRAEAADRRGGAQAVSSHLRCARAGEAHRGAGVPRGRWRRSAIWRTSSPTCSSDSPRSHCASG